jgi:putative transposase
VRGALVELMQAEVEQLCGPRHQRGHEREHRRAGSEAGVFYTQGGKEAIERPRVRRKSSNGSQEEVRLHSYSQARSIGNIEQEIFGRMSEGVSTPGCERLSGQTISASTASRLWVEGSLRQLEELRGRDLSKETFLGLMVDGVYLGRELVVVVALGITCTGEKRMLDFAVGSTESHEVVKGLLVRLQARSFTVDGKLLAVLDGAQALRKSDHSECSRLMRRLREGQGEQAGREALQALRKFLGTRNAAALASLEEAGEDLITLHLLNVPATLNTSLLSINVIENAILNYRRQTG